jgi:hypothetical protein
MVQASPSSQLTGCEVQVGAPVNGSGWQVPPVVHRLLSSQTDPEGIGVETQVPPEQVSKVHGLASSQTIGVLTHAPVAGSQVSAVHGSASAHFGVPWQIGLGLEGSVTQVSPVVHGSPSLQEDPEGAGVKTQPPVAALHVSVVHGLPSSQAIGVELQPPVAGLQTSVVHGLPSLQLTGWPQVPDWQVFPTVQAFWSSHGVPFGAGVDWQSPVVGLQVSVVQGLPSSQSALVVQISAGRTVTPTPGSFTQIVRSVASVVNTEPPEAKRSRGLFSTGHPG